MPSISQKYIELLIERYPPLSVVRESVVQTVASIIECHQNGGKILLCGNGGSSADAEHIVGELAKSFVLPRAMPEADREKLSAVPGHLAAVASHRLQRGLRAFSLSGSSPLATAIANDIDPGLIFAQMTYVLGQPGDILVGISTSGNSPNVVAAFTVAKAFGLTTIALTGSRPCELDSLSDIALKAPATETYRIQEFHLPIYHTICLTVEQELFG